MTKEEKLVKRIEMFLRKAESTPYPEEAETFMAAAEKLMLRHGIERAMVEASRDGGKAFDRESIVIEKIKLDGMWQTAWCDGFSAVVRAMGNRGLMSKHGGSTYLWVVGFRLDVEDCARIIHSLVEQSKTAQSVWWREYLPQHRYLTSHERHVERRTFMEYFGYGAARRIKDELEAAVSETAGSELVLRDKTAVITAYVNDTFNVKPTASRRSSTGWAGGGAGFVAGQAATTRRSIDG